MIYLEKNHLDLVFKILNDFLKGAEFYVFGSRATGQNKKHSDLDVAINHLGNPIDNSTMGKMKEALMASPLPIRVDLVDLNNIEASFREKIFSTAIKVES